MRINDQDIDNLVKAIITKIKDQHSIALKDDIISRITNLQKNFIKKGLTYKAALYKSWCSIIILEVGSLKLLQSFLGSSLGLYSLKEKEEPTILDKSLYINYGNPINLYLLQQGLEMTLKEGSDYDKQEQNILGYLYPTKTREDIQEMYYIITIVKVLAARIEKIFISVINSNEDLAMNSSTVPSKIIYYSRDLPFDLYDHTNYFAAFGMKENSECIEAIVRRAIRIVSTDNIRKQIKIDAKIENFIIRVREEHIDLTTSNNFSALLKVVEDFQRRNEEKFNQDFFRNVGICKSIEEASILKPLPVDIILQITGYILLQNLKRTPAVLVSYVEDSKPNIEYDNDKKLEVDIDFFGLVKNLALDTDV